MMPLIQPLPNAYSKPTEYEKERAHVAELQVELRRRNGRASRLVPALRSTRVALVRVFQRLWPLRRRRVGQDL